MAFLSLHNSLLALAAGLAAFSAIADPLPPMRSFERFTALPDSGDNTAHSSDISLADVTGSGHLDIILSTGRHWAAPLRLYLGDGKGDFLTSQIIGDERGYKSYGIPLADLTGSGHLDLVVGTDLGDEKPILLNDGHGHFKKFGTFGTPDMPTRNIVLADLNGDGFPDIVMGNRGGVAKTGSQSWVFLNDGKGHFDEKKPFGGPHDSNVTVIAADVDGHGILDLVVARRDGQQSVVLMNDGKADFPEARPFGPAQADTRAVAVGDFRRTGRPDIVACHLGLGTFIYMNDGKGNFNESMKLSDRSDFYCFAVADLNRNGRPDIVGGGNQHPNAIFFNEGLGTAFREVPFGGDQKEVATYGVAIGDLNGDGFPDIAVARTGAQSGIFFSSPASQP